MKNQISLWIRSVMMTILFPGFVVGYVPFALLLPAEISLPTPWLFTHSLALVMGALGLVILLRCVWEFAHFGKGTLAPFDEPQKLVVQGLYRYVRNPMYVGVVLMLFGEALFFRSWVILAWAGAFFVLSSTFVMLYEEHRLQEKFGASYKQYCKSVGRWIPGKPYTPVEEVA